MKPKSADYWAGQSECKCRAPRCGYPQIRPRECPWHGIDGVAKRSQPKGGDPTLGGGTCLGD
eukprot:3576616-Prorocentrum_lima.AAC.1